MIVCGEMSRSLMILVTSDLDRTCYGRRQCATIRSVDLHAEPELTSSRNTPIRQRGVIVPSSDAVRVLFGRVIDEKTHRPLGGATVELVGSSGAASATDEGGLFVLLVLIRLRRNLLKGEYDAGNGRRAQEEAAGQAKLHG